MPTNLLTFGGLSGATYYAVIVSQTLQFANAAALENYNAAHWTSGNYCNLFSASTGPGTIFSLVFPALPAGQYDVYIYTRAAGSPATTDAIADGFLVTWDGTNITSVVSAYTAPASAAAIAAAIQSLGAISFTLISPFMQNGSITLVAGDDYFNADGRAISFTLSAGSMPDFTGGSVQLQLRISASNPNAGTQTLNVSGVVSASGPAVNQVVYAELSAAQTAALAIGANGYTFGMVVTLASGHKVTVGQGLITVKSEP